MRRRTFLGTMAAAALAPLGRAAGARFEVTDNGFRLDGKPFVIRSGSMHYPRVPRPYWRDRMRKLRELGLNTLCTYVFWNAHEPRPGEFDFSDNLDVATYLRTAQEEGLWVLLRPGPYVCSEWDFGGFPAWLLRPPGMQVRSRDPRFLAAADRYLRRLSQEAAALQVTRGGPILMTQVENEYGSYGNDHAYMEAIQTMIRGAGFEVPLYTADGPSQRLLGNGTLPGLPCVINFGDGDSPDRAFTELARFRSTGPRMCGEYWDGWFDHWGEQHHTTPPSAAANGVDWMLAQNISFNLYMAHGGTSFGFMAGANYGRFYQPDVSSYDYDAPIDEAGRLTDKFTALRAVIAKHLPARERLPEVSPTSALATVPRFSLQEHAPLAQLFDAPLVRDEPAPMEALGQTYGLVWYRTNVAQPRSGWLDLSAMRGYARIYQGSRMLGIVDSSRGEHGVELDLSAGTPLDIVVECMGRVNFGPHLTDNLQGIRGPVILGEDELHGWQIVPLPLMFVQLQALEFRTGTDIGPGFHRGRFELDRPADFFLNLEGWGKGYVWVNGRNLGRYWDRGPQRRVYVPGCWLHAGVNELVVFDWDGGRPRYLQSAPPFHFDSIASGNS